jgi:hypothetical protein
MKSYILWLRIAYWWGIIADALETIRMSWPKLFVSSGGFNISPESVEFRFGLLYGVPVMLGWTLVLFWADRRPVERKGILLCLLPVIAAYMIVQIVGISLGVVALTAMIPTFVLQTILFSLCSFSYANAARQQRVQ